MPRPAQRRHHETIGFLVADDLFADGVVANAPADANGDVRKMQDRAGAMGGFGVATGATACAHRVREIDERFRIRRRHHRRPVRYASLRHGGQAIARPRS